MRPATAPQMRVLIAAARNGGRLPLNCLAYAGVFATYRGIEPIHAALTEAAQQRSHFATRRTLLIALDHGQLLMAGGCVGIERRGEDSGFMLAEALATAIRDRHGRIEGITHNSVRACIRRGWLDDRWNLTGDGVDAALVVDPAAYTEANNHAQTEARQEQFEPFAARIRAIRTAYHEANGTPMALLDGRQAAIDEDHADALEDSAAYSQNAEYRHRMQWQQTVDKDHADALEDSAAYSQNAEYRHRMQWQQTVDKDHADAMTEHYYRLRDEHVAAGGIVVGAECYAGEGDYAAAVQWLMDARSSDFRDDPTATLTRENASWVAASPEAVEQRIRTAMELMDARRAAGAPVDLVLIDDEAAAAFALDTDGTRTMLERIIRAGRDPRVLPGHGPYGVADYTQPLTGFERRAGVVDPGKAAAVTDLVASELSRGWTATVNGGKTFIPSHASSAAVAAAMIGVKPATLSPDERAALAAGITPAMYARLLPGTDPRLVDEFRPVAEYVRDAITTAIAAGSPGGVPAHPRELEGDPTAAGYRVRAHQARLRGYPEAVRKALFFLELALTAGSNNSRGMALNALNKAIGRLGVPAYQPPTGD